MEYLLGLDEFNVSYFGLESNTATADAPKPFALPFAQKTI